MGSPHLAPVRVAVLGYGSIGRRHALAVQNNPDAELVAIVDPLPQTAATAASLHVAYYPSLTELLAACKPDLVIVSTPNQTHAPAATELAAAGVHMLIEKPFCASVAEGRTLLAVLQKAADERGVHAAVGHHRRFNPYAVAAKQAIDGGALGRLLALNALWMLKKPDAYFDQAAWRRTPSAGPVLVNLIHDVDLFHYFAGPIARVQTEGLLRQRGHPVEEGAAMVLRFRSGVVATCLLSDNTPAPYSLECGTGENPALAAHGQDCYRLFGSAASLSVPDMTRWSYDGQPVQDWSHAMTQQTLVVDHSRGKPLDQQLANLVAVIRGQAPAPRSTPRSGLAALIVCEAIKTSLATGQAVDLEPYDV